MKRVIFFSVLALIASSGYAQFRDTQWGMSLEQVIEIEGRGEITQLGDTTLMTYPGQLLGFTGRIHFRFKYGELVVGAYIMPPESFYRIDAAMRQRFGVPYSQNSFSADWWNDDTHIKLARTPQLGDNPGFVTIIYHGRMHENALDEARAKADASAF